jgi:hypothetical protein
MRITNAIQRKKKPKDFLKEVAANLTLAFGC